MSRCSIRIASVFANFLSKGGLPIAESCFNTASTALPGATEAISSSPSTMIRSPVDYERLRLGRACQRSCEDIVHPRHFTERLGEHTFPQTGVAEDHDWLRESCYIVMTDSRSPLSGVLVGQSSPHFFSIVQVGWKSTPSTNSPTHVVSRVPTVMAERFCHSLSAHQHGRSQMRIRVCVFPAAGLRARVEASGVGRRAFVSGDRHGIIRSW